MQKKLATSNDDISQLLGENMAMVRRLVVIREKERQHLATELHDVFGQYLAAIDANLIAAQNTVTHDSKTYQILQSVLSSCQFLTNVTRNKLRDLKPLSLKNLGLSGAIEELVEQWKLTFKEYKLTYHLDINDELISEDVALTIYRAIQEGLVNVVRHAKAKNININVVSSIHNCKVAKILLTLDDDGNGFESGASMGIGLVAMRERSYSLNGEFSINSIQPHGTQIRINLPYLSPKI
jgi:signal transduction histidine kinase